MQELREKNRAEQKSAIEMLASTENKEKLKVLGNVIITNSHVDSILGALEKHSVMAHEDFFWQSQLRYYWEDQGGVGNLMIRHGRP